MNNIISRNYSTVTHRSGRGTLSIARCVKRPRSLHVAIYVRGKRVVAHNRYLFPTCLIASNYFTGACQRRWSIHMGVMLESGAFFDQSTKLKKNLIFTISLFDMQFDTFDYWWVLLHERGKFCNRKMIMYVTFSNFCKIGLKLSSYFFIISRNLFVTFFLILVVLKYFFFFFRLS